MNNSPIWVFILILEMTLIGVRRVWKHWPMVVPTDPECRIPEAISVDAWMFLSSTSCSMHSLHSSWLHRIGRVDLVVEQRIIIMVAVMVVGVVATPVV